MAKGPKNHAELAWSNFHQATRRASRRVLPREWRITMLFYAALHGASHVLHAPRWAPESNHQEREQRLFQARPGLFPAYKALSKLSWVARYEPWLHPMREADEKDARLLALEVLVEGAVPCHLELELKGAEARALKGQARLKRQNKRRTKRRGK